MLVSVLMSVYNEESRYIRAAIDSILNQTYKNFEFIIVGDSPDSDRERVFDLVLAYSANDSRIVFVPNETNIGLTKSLNVGLRYCTGKYIARMDADDISVPTRLEKQVQFMEDNGHILASSAWYQYVDENGMKLNTIIRTCLEPAELRLGILRNSVLGHPVSIFHRMVNNAPVKYDESVVYAQDYSLWVWILQYGELSNIQEVLLYYRTATHQISAAHRKEQLECARVGQRNAFSLLYGFPIVDTFMKVMSQITLEGCDNVPEEVAREAFRTFFRRVEYNANNSAALKYLSSLYVNYYYGTTHKRAFHLLFDITRNNLILLLVVEVLCVKNFIQRLLCVGD